MIAVCVPFVKVHTKEGNNIRFVEFCRIGIQMIDFSCSNVCSSVFPRTKPNTTSDLIVEYEKKKKSTRLPKKQHVFEAHIKYSINTCRGKVAHTP